MTTDVYADILFLINAGMDCLCYLLTARLMKKQIQGWRLCMASAAGGGYAVLALFLTVGQKAALAIDIATCLLLCRLALPPPKNETRGRRLKSLITTGGVYLLVSLVMGGVMTGLYNLLNRAGCPEALTGAGDDGPTAWLFALLALVGGGLSLWGGKLFRRTGSRRTAALTIRIGQKTVTLDALVDSGNLLTDPLDGRPVIPVEITAVEPLLSPALVACLRAGDTAPETLCRLPEAARLRVIPAATATGQKLLIGIRPDRVTIRTDPRGEELAAVALLAPLTLPPGSDPDAPPPQALIPATLI